MANWLNTFLLLILALTLFVILLAEDRRKTVIAYWIAIAIVFFVNIQFWRFGFALTKLFPALVAPIILGVSPAQSQNTVFGQRSIGIFFKSIVFSFGLILLLISGNQVSTLLNLSLDQTLISLFLILCGVIVIGISIDIYHVILGLITVFIGFEVIYASVENSLLINGLLSAMILMIAVVGSYLLNQTSIAEDM